MAKKQLKIPFKDGRPCKWVKDVHDDNVTCDKHEQNEAIRKSQNS